MSATEQGIHAKTDAELDLVSIKQLTWKSASCARIAVRICNRALANPIFYPDEIDHDDLPEDDRNCVGSVFRTLSGRRLGIIERGTTFKRSESDGRRGSTVFAYSLKSRGLATALVKRLGAQAEEPQKDLLLNIRS